MKALSEAIKRMAINMILGQLEKNKKELEGLTTMTKQQKFERLKLL